MDNKIVELLHVTNGSEIDPERLARLNPEQLKIVLKREEDRKYRIALIDKLRDPNIDTHEQVFNALRDLDGDECEHGRSNSSTCISCEELDQLLFPEMFDANGDLIED